MVPIRLFTGRVRLPSVTAFEASVTFSMDWPQADLPIERFGADDVMK